jgi:hypothetical protein
MKKVKLDEIYDKWRDKNIEDICDRFQQSDKFEEFVEECWREYQNENGLIDKSNEGTDKLIEAEAQENFKN